MKLTEVPSRYRIGVLMVVPSGRARGFCRHAGLMSVNAKSWPLNGQGFARRFGERIGKTVAEVEAGLVAALAEVEIGLPGGIAVLEAVRSTMTPARRKKASAWRMPSGPSWLSITIDSST